MEKYRKIKVVGKGSFGHAVLVQTANDPNKHYIMKIIDVSKMERKQKEEALNEVHVLKAMRHPFICTYRESFMEKRCLCIVMDYADGGDLYTRIAKQKERGDLFTEKQILDWFVQIALALKHVHDRKILHRDIKTQNIFLTSKSEIKLGDFGIARILQNTDDCAKTAIGTPYYLSPEICQEKPYNQKSDIWSLGCILYEMVTLNHAFDADNMKSLVMKILKADYSPIPSIYSDNLKLLISEMLIKDPAQRPSIKKILQKDFLSSRISDLLMSTLTRHTTYDSGNQYRSNQSKERQNSKTDRENSSPDRLRTELNNKYSVATPTGKSVTRERSTERPGNRIFEEKSQNVIKNKIPPSAYSSNYQTSTKGNESAVKKTVQSESKASKDFSKKLIDNVIQENLYLMKMHKELYKTPEKSNTNVYKVGEVNSNDVLTIEDIDKSDVKADSYISCEGKKQKINSMFLIEEPNSGINNKSNPLNDTCVAHEGHIIKKQGFFTIKNSLEKEIGSLKIALEKNLGQDRFNRAYAYAQSQPPEDPNLLKVKAIIGPSYLQELEYFNQLVNLEQEYYRFQ